MIRNRPHRAHERLRTMAGSRRASDPIIVELAANAPPPVLAAVEAAIEAAAPAAAVSLVRVRAMSLPRGEPVRMRAFIAWDAPASVQRRHARAMVAFAEAFEAALAAAGGSGGRA